MDTERIKFRELLKTIPLFSGSPVTIAPESQSELELNLINAALLHVRLNTSGIIREENLVVVHPYWNAKQPPRKEVLTIENLLRGLDHELYATVLFENYLGYLLRSHELVDEGLIDRVIFTYGDNGVPLNVSDARGFSISKNNYICGSKGYECVVGASHAIRCYAPVRSVRPVTDAIVYGTFTLNPVTLLDIVLSAFKGVKSTDLLVSK